MADKGKPVIAAERKQRVSIGEFFRQVRTEVSKIVWPSREETLRTAVMVVIMTTILGVFFFGVDSFFGWVVKWLMSLLA